MIRRFAGASLLALVSAAPLSAQELLHPVGEGAFNWDSYQSFADSHDYSGQSLKIAGANTGNDAERYRNLYAYFAEATGASVEYSGSESFEQDIVIAAQAGGLPDIANFPQPGLAKDLAKQGVLQPLDQEVADWVTENYAAGSSWADLATFDGAEGDKNIYGLFFGTDVKSLVWYSPEQFEESGYEIPETQEELKALSDQIVEDGGTPWCIGLGSGAATGWPATDWVEDMMLRTVPVDVYDQWVNHEIPFNDERIVAAIEEYGHYARTPDYTPAGPEAVATTDFRDAPDGLFEFPPECYMHKQASFIPIFFPEDVVVGEDAEFFYFPPFEANADLGRPVLGSGGLTTMTKDSEVARGFIEFLETPFAHEIMMSQGQFLTPHAGANLDIYTTDTQRALGEILTSATSFRFDGSDLMPGEIGTNAFWTGMVDYTTGAEAQSVADKIEERWNAIQ
ncbi:MAG: alpha-glucoside transport system substrate-binding protein [Limimaricola cinnabarinus]|jgi:alpha-glucoside transport system substrate-binding protein|uniref:Alpha-glucosides-binding periplasmic protein AglE n=1 Tax=Limimaricola cinnabarinus LL-001 TaxID=1337093 RepID=U2Z7U5_9RHOB|nr:ABC transporter substrate-binding protein [Limimaricola cinnabarinus]GAD57525.1 alpha-glucosides-binding periplasmic protein AglE precursor [Limimaricola cinnabarinus LL-001]